MPRIKQLILSEKKQYNQSYATNIIDNDQPTRFWFTKLKQGDAENERLGKKVQLKTLQINADIKQNNNATMTSIRFCLVSSRLSEGEFPDLSQMFMDDEDYRTPYNLDYFGKDFIVLDNKYYDLSINGTRIKRYKYYQEFPKYVCNYVKNDTSEAEDPSMIGPNQIFLYVFCNEATAAGAAVNLTYRITYWDP